MDEPRLHATLPLNPRDLLDGEYRRRIAEAYDAAKEIELKAEADLESRAVDRDSPRGAQALNRASFKGAEVVLRVIAGAFGNLAPNLAIFREWMEDEIEGACNSRSLHDAQKQLLSHTLRTPPLGCSVPSVDPLKEVLAAIEVRIRDTTKTITQERDESYKQISLSVGSIEKVKNRLQAYETFASRRALLIVDSYLEVVRQFSADELLSLVRLEHYRRRVQDSIQIEGKTTREMNERDCVHDSITRDKAKIHLWQAQGRIMNAVVTRLRAAQSDVAAIAFRVTTVPKAAVSSELPTRDAKLASVHVRWLERDPGVLKRNGITVIQLAIQCCRDAYDAIAEDLMRRSSLTETALQKDIPGQVFDFAIEKAWFRFDSGAKRERKIVARFNTGADRGDSWIGATENWFGAVSSVAKSTPPKQNSVQLGSHCVLESVSARFMGNLAGRIEHWKSRLDIINAPLPPLPELVTATPLASETPRFPRRALWLRDRLRERSWNHNHPRGFGGPDRKTMLDMLAGKPSKEETLAKLVIALNKNRNGEKIDILDIPND